MPARARLRARNRRCLIFGVRQAEAPFRIPRATYGRLGISRSAGLIAHFRGGRKVDDIPATYCRASGMFRTARQAGGNCAMVIGGFGFGGSFGGFGCSVESLNQKARSPVEQPSLVSGSGWVSHSPEPGGHLMRMWKW